MKDFNPQITVGALLAGVIIANVLFGVSTVQVHVYYRTFPGDRWTLKILVRDQHVFMY
jgi:hypothetical protein